MKYDFIEIYKEYAPPKLCDDLVAALELALGTKDEYYVNDWHRKDQQILLDTIDQRHKLSIELNRVLDKALNEYVQNWMVSLAEIPIASYRIKIQKTSIGGGFHVWHCEQSQINTDRLLTWTVFLNDVPEGEGELEFINFPIRLQPCKGDVVIFPATFTHTHRGNPPRTVEKYIATGWWNLTARD